MRKTFVAIIAATTLGIAWADGVTNQDQFRDQPQARAYLTYGFGHAASDVAAPLHYGLRLDHESRLYADTATGLPVDVQAQTPLAQFDLDNRGALLASLNGVPFAGVNVRLNDDSGGGSAPQTQPGGFTFFDWALLAVGVGGAGVLIAEATKGKNDPNPPAGSTTGGSTGGLLGGLTGGFTDVRTTAAFDEERNLARQKWLDSGTGHMGDLGGH